MMKYFMARVSLFLALFLAFGVNAQAQENVKDHAHEAGQDIKHAAHEVGEGVKAGAHKVASVTKEGAHEVAHVAKEGAHAVATGAKEGAHAVANGAKKVKDKVIVECGNGDHAVRRDGACDHAGGTARSPE